MAKKTAAKKAPAKNSAPGKGHNSEAVDVNKELGKLAAAQLKLDKERRAASARFSQRHSEITGQIKALGKSRKSFNRAYEDFAALEMAKDEDEKLEIRQKQIIEQADYAEVYKALNKGQTLNFLDVAREADKIRKAMAESDKAADVEEEEMGD